MTAIHALPTLNTYVCITSSVLQDAISESGPTRPVPEEGLTPAVRSGQHSTPHTRVHIACSAPVDVIHTSPAMTILVDSTLPSWSGVRLCHAGLTPKPALLAKYGVGELRFTKRAAQEDAVRNGAARREKKCSGCDIVQATDAFYESKHGPGRLSRNCITCIGRQIAAGGCNQLDQSSKVVNTLLLKPQQYAYFMSEKAVMFDISENTPCTTML